MKKRWFSFLALTMLFLVGLLGLMVRTVYAAEVTPNIGEITTEGNKISFEWDLSGMGVNDGDTFTINLPEGIVPANLEPFNIVTEEGIVVGQVQPNHNQVVATFNDKLQGLENVRGTMSFSVTNNIQVATGETVETTVHIGQNSVILTKTGHGPFDSVINKYNLTGTTVQKEFKLHSPVYNYSWLQSNEDYFTEWFIRINGDGTKQALSNIVITDIYEGPVGDTSKVTYKEGQDGGVPIADLFAGPYLKFSFSIAVNGQGLPYNGDQIAEHITFTGNGFRLNLSDVDPRFAVASEDTIVLGYRTLIPKGTGSIINTATFTADQVKTPVTDGGWWKNATGDATATGDQATTTVSTTETTMSTTAPSTSTTVISTTSTMVTSEATSTTVTEPTSTTTPSTSATTVTSEVSTSTVTEAATSPSTSATTVPSTTETTSLNAADSTTTVTTEPSVIIVDKGTTSTTPSPKPTITESTEPRTSEDKKSKEKRVLPSTGEAVSLLGFVGLTLLGIGVVISRKRKELR